MGFFTCYLGTYHTDDMSDKAVSLYYKLRKSNLEICWKFIESYFNLTFSENLDEEHPYVIELIEFYESKIVV